MRVNRKIIWSHSPFGGWKKIFPVFDALLGLVSLQIFSIIGILCITPFFEVLPGISLLMSMIISFFFFFLKYDLIKRNWHLLNLKYEINKDGIIFNWGIFKDHSFFLPFEHIVKSTLVGFDGSKYSKIYFHTLHDIFEFDFDFLTDDEVMLLVLNHVPNGKKVFELIEKLRTEKTTPEPEHDLSREPIYLNRLRRQSA